MKKIQIEATVRGDTDKVWQYWTEPQHITKWAFASDDWEAPHAENDVLTGGKFLTRMSAKDGFSSFDFTGIYSEVIPKEKIAYAMDDGRTVTIAFEKVGEDAVKIVEEFEMESENTEELQREGWQAILNNFKKHAEGS
jgi:uncharacterized protein YndB with AHSA1/START domain